MKDLLARWLSRPLLSLTLLIIWLLLARSLNAAQVLVGLLLALAVPRLVTNLLAPRVRLKGAGRMLRYVAIVMHDVVASNIAVAWGVLSGGRQRPTAGFVVIPLELRDPVGLAVLAMVTTIVPGTVWSELAVDRSAMLLHVWEIPDEPAFVARFKARYEHPLREIFE
jgi:multicomponent K+:H+ antiporter subunit E